MTNVATLRAPPQGVVADMADRFGMSSEAFERTLRATVFPNTGTREAFAAFLLVAREYNLNPITKQIYAFPGKGGGIVPIVSIDGWFQLVNSHPQFDGMDFAEAHDETGKLIATKCTIYRKDRSHPIAVTEYLAECYRQTEPWKMAHRMLRHKAAIQCARYAFGFAGVYDEDEGQRIVETQLPQASRPPTPPAPPPQPTITREEPKQIPAPPAETMSAQSVGIDTEALLKQWTKVAAEAGDPDALQESWERTVEPHWPDLFPPDRDEFLGVFRAREKELAP